MKQPSSNDSETPLSDEWIDRLVDGEVRGTEYQRLLRALERAPDGWRRCALAFLESQAWSRDLAGKGTLEPPRETVAASPETRRLRPATAGWTLGIVASALLAFSAGYFSRGSMPQRPPASLAEVGGEPSRGAQRSPPVNDHGPQPRGSTVEPSFLQAGERAPLEGLEIALEDAASAGNGSVNVPVFALGDEGVEQVFSEQSQVPADFVQAVEQSGGRVLHSRQWLPVPLQDGRQVLVPIEQVDIIPLAGRHFQ